MVAFVAIWGLSIQVNEGKYYTRKSTIGLPTISKFAHDFNATSAPIMLEEKAIHSGLITNKGSLLKILFTSIANNSCCSFNDSYGVYSLTCKAFAQKTECMRPH